MEVVKRGGGNKDEVCYYYYTVNLLLNLSTHSILVLVKLDKDFKMDVQEYKTLKELDVQVGDVVSYSDSILYTVEDNFHLYSHGYLRSRRYSLWDSGRYFTIVSRAEQTKTFGNLSTEEKGVLLLAHHEGKEIECLQRYQNAWLVIADPKFNDSSAYRIAAPKPFVESLKMKSPLHFKGGRSLNKKEYNITVQFTDGVPDVETIQMEKIHD